MKILVQKFGGTSVSTEDRREMVVDKVEAALKNGFFPVVVVSAMGRDGDSYATDTLLSIVKSSSCEINPRELDLLMSCGEIISSVVMASTLKKRGHESVALTGGQAGIITDNNFGDAEVIKVDSQNILKYIEKDIIPVITGFQGVNENGDITTLGRGGSDVSGVIIGEALNADAVEIYTDVEGVMTADPRIVPDARVMNTIFYNEIFQMAEYGAKVIHPRAVEIAMRSNIPLIIKNTMTDSPGTLITNCDRSRKYRLDKKDKIITAVAQIGNRTQVKIFSNKNMDEYQRDDFLFSLIAAENISLDMINLYPESKVFIIDDSQLDRLKRLMENRELQYEVKRNCSKVTIIGNKMRGVPGVMAKVVKALSSQNIELLQTSDSHTTISCLIDSKYTNKAVNALHEEFELGKMLDI